MSADPSIFHKLVAKEDEFTQLLCNLMNRLPAFRREVLKMLLGEEMAARDGANPQPILTQRSIGGHGRPDFLIRGEGFVALVEAKTVLRRGPTPLQSCDPDEPRGYIHYLGQQAGSLNRGLVYLVPRAWEGLADLTQVLKQAESTHPDVSTQIRHWEEICDLITRLSPEAQNPFIGELGVLLNQNFNPLNFLTEDMTMLESDDFAEAFKATCKLEVLIGQVAKAANKEGLTKGDLDCQEEEYGVYFPDRRNPLLWFGMWSEPWKEYEARFARPSPRLWFGLEEKWGAKKATIFREEVGEANRMQIDGNWILSWIDNCIVESANPVHEILAKLRPLVTALQERG